MMAEGKEVAVDSSTESGDTCDAERFRVAPSIKVIAGSEDDSYDAERYRVALSGRVIALSAKVIASSGGGDEAPTSKVEVKERGKQKAAWPVSKDSAVPTANSSKDPAVSTAQSSSKEAKRLRLRGTNEWITVDSFVRLRCGASTSVARVAKIERDPSAQLKHKVHVRWCLKPEETKAGRQPFHGVNELVVSDRETVEEWTSVVGGCNVLSLEDDMKRSGGGGGGGKPTYFWRFEYEMESGNCYRIDYYCTKCDAKNKVGPLTLQQQLTGEPPYFKCPLCAAPPGAPDQQPQKT